jgi:hypothetical protein
VIQTHTSRDEAIQFHLERTKHFINGGSEEEWSLGFDDYLKLYEQWCPRDLKETRAF